MTKINFIDPEGSTHAVDVADGMSIMDGAVRSGVPGVLAECGGNLSCATCHVYVDPAWVDRAGAVAPGSMEDELLDEASADRIDGSRLSCQIEVTELLDGLVVHVAPEQA